MPFVHQERASICADVLERLQTGEPLSQICRTTGYPNPSTIWRWSEDDPEFAQGIARARLAGFDVIAEDCLNIADDNGQDTRYADGKDIVDADVIQRAKLRIETRLKLLAKWDPKRYGERITQEHVMDEGFASSLDKAMKRATGSD
jgi:hypothetical protein